MKRIRSILAMTLLMISMMSVAVFAHGGHGHGNRVNSQPAHTLCTVENCAEIGPHQHDGDWYCSQTGRTDYAACPVEGCAELGLHQHDGTYYCHQNHSARTGCGRGRNR